MRILFDGCIRTMNITRIISMCRKSFGVNIHRRKTSWSLVSTVLGTPAGSAASVQGWVKNLRIQKEYVFADINDGSCAGRLQVVIPKEIKPNTLSYGCSVQVSGVLSESPRGQKELKAEAVTVLGECVVTDGFPFNPRTAHPPDYTRQFLHLRSRTNHIAALLRIRNTLTMAVHGYLQSRNFLNINTPILTSNDCEGAGEVFRVRPENEMLIKSMMQEGKNADTTYFGEKTFLTVSGQLQLEAMCRSLGNVYTLGPTFRAENSKSRLHLSEFYMLEVEIAFCTRLEQIQVIIEDMIKHLIKELLEKREEDLSILKSKDNPIKIESWLENKFVTLTYKEALQILISKNAAVESSEGINKEQELALVAHCGGTPVFVVEWPKHMKSFYMKENFSDDSKVDALDLLAPITGEIVGGSVREDSYSKLQAKLPSEDLGWYLELRKFGNIPTGGFGLGIERLLQVLCGVANIKDTIPFPRWPHNCAM